MAPLAHKEMVQTVQVTTIHEGLYRAHCHFTTCQLFSHCPNDDHDQVPRSLGRQLFEVSSNCWQWHIFPSRPASNTPAIDSTFSLDASLDQPVDDRCNDLSCGICTQKAFAPPPPKAESVRPILMISMHHAVEWNLTASLGKARHYVQRAHRAFHRRHELLIGQCLAWFCA
jgi:hypothetical protein